MHILIERGENLPVHLVLGNTLGWEDQFIRKEGETNVYLIHTNLSRQMEVYGEDSPKSSVWVDKTILDIDKGKIVEVVLSWPDKKLHFEREEVEKEIQKEGEERKTEIRWVVKEGSPETEFEEDEFENLLGSLSSLDATGVVDPKKYEELGLDKPNYSCQIKLEDGKERKITASRTDPSKDAYLIVDERRDVIYQLSSFKFEEVFRKGGELFSLKGPDLDKEKIKEILITVEKRQYKFLKDGESWSLQEPNIQLEIKEDTLKDIASEFASLEFDDFAQGDKDSFGLSSPLNSLVVKTETGKKHSLRLGERAKSVEGNYVLLDDEDTVYVLSKSDVEEFFPEDREIFNLSLTDISSWELKKMVVQRRGEQMTFNKIEEEWKVQRDGREIEADEEKIEDFIDKITGLEGKSFTFTKRPLGSEEAELIISLEEREGRKSQILFGESSDGMRLLRVDDKNFSYLLNEEEFKDLLKKLEEFEKPQQPEDSEQ
ncbi:MAG TPA: DUF4340 domain-containing protein [Candidatus Omnitrophica bacterium]|nr:DUF4340 domain-containing protein [Candidatus Omnitrophota bacterium]